MEDAAGKTVVVLIREMLKLGVIGRDRDVTALCRVCSARRFAFSLAVNTPFCADFGFAIVNDPGGNGEPMAPNCVSKSTQQLPLI
jgi:hypothetical protein